MKHIIILGDGMADRPVMRLGGKTPLQYAETPYMDMLACKGCTGRLVTIPEGFHSGSEVANAAILGYNLDRIYEGRGPLEAASIGYDMRPDDFAIRCNLITLDGDVIKNHHGGHVSSQEGDVLIKYLNDNLSSEKVHFISGMQHRHLLIIQGGNKHIMCSPPHENLNGLWKELLVKSEPGWENKKDGDRMTGGETADIINSLIIKSYSLLSEHYLNVERCLRGDSPANCIWPWSGGYRPDMEKLNDIYTQIKSGSVISAADLIRGIGYYAGLNIVKVKGATGLSDTNYEGKVAAAINALRNEDFVFLHLEATDEAGHDGNLDLKLRTIEFLDRRVVRPIYEEVVKWTDNPVCMAILPDHPTSVETRKHLNEPVPFLIWHSDIKPDAVKTYDEISCASGGYGLIRLNEFMETFMRL